MLCKRTMRAALAPLVGLVGLLGAAMVSANTLDAVVASQLPDVKEAAGAPTIASETLSEGTMKALLTEGHYHVKTSSTTATGGSSLQNPTQTGKPDTWLELRTEVDTLLSNRSNASAHYYVRYDLNGMVFSQAVPKPEVRLPYQPPCTDVSTQGTCTGTATTTVYMSGPIDAGGITVAYRGRKGDGEVIFRLPSASGSGNTTYTHPMRSTETQSADLNGDYAVGTTVTLLLPNHLAVEAAREATYTATMRVFESLTAAQNDGEVVYSANGDVVELAPAVGAAKVTAMVATAEVSTPEDEGGAFRLFMDANDDGDPETSANLASVSVGLVDKPGAHANNNLMTVTDAIITGVTANATSAAGNFGFGATFKISGMMGCPGSGLTLMKPGEDGQVALEEGDSNDVATSASGAGMKGMSYFCVAVGAHNPDADPPVHRQAIPEVGDVTMKNGYMLSVTPMIAEGAPAAVMPPMGMAMAAGSIDRNGTTVHISYLSGSDNAAQRLVIVNRGRDAARFWMHDFQSEGAQMVTHAGDMMLAQSSNSEVPAGGRVVISIPANLSFSERPPRTAGTLTVAAATRNIDVMTVQVSGGSLDTTVYQHAE